MPRAKMTKEQIVRTAVELLDDEGLEGLNMRALGARLGTVATAVYWHVKNKDDLVLLAGDHVWNEIELPDLDTADWRTAAASMAHGLHAMLTRHPWLTQAFGSYVIYGPGKARHDDHCLAVYEEAGFTSEEADQAAAAVFTYVLGSALGVSAVASLTRRLARTGGDPDELLQQAVAQAGDVAMRFPRLRARLETPTAAQYAAAPDATFELGLRALLGGLEDQLRARDGARSTQ
ncbi:TetR/AcrR family transcriptional regulator [Streptomyces sp. NPDC127110]|uniref:TetR/AcrR family transcriptional regulator n=1 Tax=Streptomyces sp. NPDC127110 TaxID=3345362 RepID=UPI003638CB91